MSYNKLVTFPAFLLQSLSLNGGKVDSADFLGGHLRPYVSEVSAKREADSSWCSWARPDELQNDQQDGCCYREGEDNRDSTLPFYKKCHNFFIFQAIFFIHTSKKLLRHKIFYGSEELVSTFYFTPKKPGARNFEIAISTAAPQALLSTGRSYTM